MRNGRRNAQTGIGMQSAPPAPEAHSPAGPVEAPPLLDTPQARDALACPLCAYSLRGLSAAERPQCPECGYGFDWGELLRARQYAHPFLFEHHPRRNVRSLLWTLLAGVWPRRFWSSLNAGHEIHRNRLFAYWAVTAVAIAVAGFVGTFVAEAAARYREYVFGWFPRTTTPWRQRFLRSVAQAMWDEGSLELYLLAAALAWPWLTLAALLVYQASMRRAKVRAAHVVRVVVYCGDVFLWTGAAFALLGLLRWTGILSRGRMWDDALAARQTATAFLLLALVAAYRLGVAYRRYLRFDHPWATVVAAQVVVLLFVTTALTWLYGDFWRLLPQWMT